MLKQKRKSPIRLNFVSCKKRKKKKRIFFNCGGGGGGVTLLSLNPNSINSCFFLWCVLQLFYIWVTLFGLLTDLIVDGGGVKIFILWYLRWFCGSPSFSETCTHTPTHAPTAWRLAAQNISIIGNYYRIKKWPALFRGFNFYYDPAPFFLKIFSITTWKV